LARAVDRNLEGAHDALAKLNDAESSAQVLAGVTFNTFEWAPNSFNKHSRSWRGEAATLTERFFDFEPDFDSFDVDEIREEMIELQGYLQSPSFDIASLDLEEYLGKINSASMPSQVTLIELDCFLHEGVKCVSSISRHRMKGHVHFLSSTLALFKSCFYLIGIEVEEGEEVGEREGAVAQLALTTSNGGELDEVSFDPYDRRWDGLIPIDKDPLARLRILATHLRRSIHFGEYTASMEPFDPETS
jgi:hypothetical protein